MVVAPGALYVQIEYQLCVFLYEAAARLNAVAETMMDVLTGHADIHKPHPLARHGKTVIGPWGNPVIRCSIPRVPSGPRIHYTLDDAGTVVLLDVSLHDELIRD